MTKFSITCEQPVTARDIDSPMSGQPSSSVTCEQPVTAKQTDGPTSGQWSSSYSSDT